MPLFGQRSIFRDRDIDEDLKSAREHLEISRRGVSATSSGDGSVVLPGDPGTLPKHSPKVKKHPQAYNPRNTNNLTVKQRIEAEWKKIADPQNGFSYFCKNYVYINNQKHGYVQFNLYGYQERIANILQRNRFVITKKFRQAGMSLLTGVYCLWYSLVNPRMQCLIVSIGLRESSKYLQENVREVYESLPQWLKGGLDSKGKPIRWKKPKPPKDAATEVMLPNRSKIRSIPSGKSVGRGFSTKLLIMDEAAFIEDAEKFFVSVYPTITNTGGSVFVVSTVNGVGNWYYNVYKQAETKENEFLIAGMDYHEHPDYCDPHWIETTRKQLGPRGWRQEVLGEFLASGNTYIDGDWILKMEQECKEPIRKEWGDKLWIWEDPIPGHHYVVGADCATQGGLDYSTAQVFDVDSGRQVAEFKGKLHEEMFAKRLAEIGYRYNTALVAPEMNAKPGGSVVTALKSIQRYRRIFKRPENGDEGWNTNVRTRNNMIAYMESCIYDETKPWKLKSTRIIDEFKTFIVTENNKVEHDKGCHDDLLFGFMIAVAPEVIQQARRAVPKMPMSISVIDENLSEGFVGTIKPVYSSDDEKRSMRKSREDIIHRSEYGGILDQAEKWEEIAGEDVLSWLLEDTE